MQKNSLQEFTLNLLKNVPADWLKLTTHRLDIYEEERAKTEFLEQLEKLYHANDSSPSALQALPTAYDYIRLGHPLSCVLEWVLSRQDKLPPQAVISFSSQAMPLLALLRQNKLTGKTTHIFYKGALPAGFDENTLKKVYGYRFTLTPVAAARDIVPASGAVVYYDCQTKIGPVEMPKNVDFHISTHGKWGSIIRVNHARNEAYIGAIQHVRRRETIAMTPPHCLAALQALAGMEEAPANDALSATHQKEVQEVIKEITATQSPAILGSSGLSVQYAIMMGLIDEALEKHPGKAIKIIVPPNCYGGTNDQARRVAAALDVVEIVDLPVDSGHDMVQSTEKALEQVAAADAVPYIIAEIPTNPRVEVPDLQALRSALSQKRYTPEGEVAVGPIFILDQTFCPNVQFLAPRGFLASVPSIAYVSGSKFPSGGKCTAGYCVANAEASGSLTKIARHLQLCNNEATSQQLAFLAEQLPSMNARISEAYKNTRELVSFIEATLPQAKINFVSDKVVAQGFTPSVFSLDLPTQGQTHEERETYKRHLNKKLIQRMVSEIPEESKHCVSYGQLKGCYWTIPATSTQGTTKEADKDYIARVSVAPQLDLERHKRVFADFVKAEIG